MVLFYPFFKIITQTLQHRLAYIAVCAITALCSVSREREEFSLAGIDMDVHHELLHGTMMSLL